MTAPRSLIFADRPVERLDLSGYTYLPRLQAPPPQQQGLVSSALRTGFNEAQASLGSAATAAGVRLGMPGLAEWGRQEAAAQQAEADQYRRTDLEAMPWRGGNAPLPSFAAYQVLKQVPQTIGRIGTALAGTAIGGLVGGGVPGAVVGGIVGAAPAAAMAAGSLFQEAKQGGMSDEEAAREATGLKAAAYTALDVAQVGRLRGLASVAKEAAKDVAQPGVLRRVAGAALKEAGTEFVQEGAQTALEMSVRPDLSAQEKLQNVVDGAIVGGMVGGVFGTAASAMQRPARPIQTKPAATVTDDDLATTVDNAVQPQGPIAQPPIPERKALPAGVFRMGPAGSSSTAPQDLMTPYEPPAPVPPPALAPDAPVGTQGELFASLANSEAPVVAAVPETAPVAAPAIDVQQGNLFAEQEAQAQQVAEMRQLAKDAAGRSVPFINTLTATNPIELVMQVQDALTQKKVPAGVVTIGETFGLVDANGKPRNLTKEIERETAKLWNLAPKAEKTAGARQKFVEQQQRIRTLEMQRDVLDAVNQRRAEMAAPAETAPVAEAAPAAPAVETTPLVEGTQLALPLGDRAVAPAVRAPVTAAPTAPAVAEQLGLALDAPVAPDVAPVAAAPVTAPVGASEPAVAPVVAATAVAEAPVAPVVPEIPSVAPTREQAVTQMREKARQIVGRKTQFIAKLDVTNDEELKAAVMQRLEKGSAAADTMKLAEALGIDLTAPAAPVQAVAPTAPILAAAPAPIVAPEVASAPAPVVGGMAATIEQVPVAPAQPSAFTTKQDRSDPMQTVQNVMENGAPTGYVLRRANIDGREAVGMGVFWEVTAPDGTVTSVMYGGKKAALGKAQELIAKSRAASSATPVEQAPANTVSERTAPPAATVGTTGSVLEQPQTAASAADTPAVLDPTDPITEAQNKYVEAVIAHDKARAILKGWRSEQTIRDEKAARKAKDDALSALEALYPKGAPVAIPKITQAATVAPPAPDRTTWVKKHRAFFEKFSQIVHVDPEFAILRALRGNGKTLYAFAAPNGEVATTDPFSSTGDTLTDAFEKWAKRRGVSPEAIVRFQQESLRLQAEEVAMATQYPDGPFTGQMTPVVATRGVPAQVVDLTRTLLEKLGMGGVRVLLINPTEVVEQRDELKLYGDYASAMDAKNVGGNRSGRMRGFGMGYEDYFVAVDFKMSAPQMLETLTHELGHVIYYDQFVKAAPEIQKAVRDEYNLWRAANEKKKGIEIVQATRGVASARKVAQAWQNELRPGETLADLDIGAQQREYFLSFKEWFADQVARYVTTEAKPQSLVDQFFAGVASIIREMRRIVFGEKAYVASSMKTYLDAMMEGGGISAQQWADAVQQSEKATDGESDMIPSVTARVERTMRQAAKAADTLPLATLKEKTRKLALGWTTVTHIATQFKDLFALPNDSLNGLEMIPEVEQERASTAAHFAQLFDKAFSSFKALEKSMPSVAEKVGKLMRYTEFSVDPSKTWDEHTWLHRTEADVNGSVRRVDDPRLQEIVAQANKLWREVKSTGQQTVYLDLKTANETIHYAQFALELYTAIASEPAYRDMGLAGFEKNPVETFKEPGTGRSETIANAREFWRTTLETQLKSLDAMLAQETGTASTVDAADRQVIESRTMPLKAQVSGVKRSLEAMDNAPYFHLGRTGNYFVSFKMRRIQDESGKQVVDPRVVEQVAKRLEEDAGVVGVEISRDTTNSNVFIRFDSQEQAEKVWQLLPKLQAAGLVYGEEDVLSAPGEPVVTGAPIRGERTSEKPVQGLSPRWMQRIITEIEASPAFQETPDMTDDEVAEVRKQRERMVARVRQSLIDMLPDIAAMKVMTHRKAIPGYNQDMIRSFAQRMQIGVVTLSNLASEPKKLDAMTRMKAAINQNMRNRSLSTEDVIAAQDVFREIVRRDTERPNHTGKSVVDMLRAFNHSYFLGFSPAYALVNMSQVGALLWPELGKKHGFRESALAIGRVTPMAFRIMKATFQSGLKTGQWADAVISEETLRKAGVPADTAKYIMEVALTGALDIGSAARELARAAEGEIDSKFARGLRYAAFLSYYSETTSRLVAALAARELKGANSPTLLKDVNTLLNEAMFNYSSWNTPRQMGKTGVAGPYTPIMFSFMTYQQQLLEKLYREAGAAFFGQAKNKDEKIEAQRFLGSHAVAMTAIAGTLGLPFASVAARAVESLVELFGDDDEPFDAKAAWRNFLAETFGMDVGEMLSRGVVTRMLEIDISGRAGEQDILPLSRFLTDRRSWKDATKDWSTSMLGAPASMMFNIIEGGITIADGQVMKGLDKLLPASMRSVERAYRLSTEGYTDTSGNRLPMTPGSADILAQLLGFNPATKAEYSEADLIQKVREGRLTQQASQIRRQLALAYERQDREAFTSGIREARQFDQAFPAYAVLPGLPEAIKRRARARQQSRLTMSPIGANVRDPGAQQLTAFANF